MGSIPTQVNFLAHSDKDYKCSNHVEGHNRSIKTIINRNPTAWNFLDGLIDLAFDAGGTVLFTTSNEIFL